MAGTKRKAVDDVTTTPSRRLSGRVRKTQIKYDESSDDEGDKKEDEEFQDESEVEDYKSEDVDGQDEEQEDDEYNSDASENVVQKARGWKSKSKTRNDDGSYEVEIPQEKDAGDVPYEDERIHQNTLDFLKDLRKNNNRDWLKWHDKVFRQAEKDFYGFVEELTSVISEKDATVPELPVKDVIFRIYRDVRFSKDPTPYKSYFSVAWSRTGRKGPYAHYYLHIQPNGGSFFGGGYYNGESATLQCMREDIDQQPHQFKSVLMNKSLRKIFFPAVKDEEKKVLSAFCKMNAENALKTKPKGYDKDHENIELMKLKSFILRKNISDAEIVSEDSLRTIGDIVEAMEPFITYLNEVVMPDR